MMTATLHGYTCRNFLMVTATLHRYSCGNFLMMTAKLHSYRVRQVSDDDSHIPQVLCAASF